MASVLRLDRADLPKVSQTQEGYLRGDAVVTRTGVLVYRLPDGTVRRELRHPDEVFKAESLASMRMIPVTDGHPAERLLTAATARERSIGMTGENVRADGKHVVCPLCITDAQAVERIVQQGGRELSLGYEVDLVMEDGTYDGEPYDARQTNIRYNHLSVVDRARAGHEARIHLDGEDGVLEPQTDHRRHDMPEPTKELARVTLDSGLTYEAAPEVVHALNKLRKDAEEMEEEIKEKDEEIEKAKADGEKLKAERDALKEKCDSLEKRDLSAEIAKGVKARVALLDSARKALPADQLSKLDSMSDEEIKRAVILAVSPKAVLDGASPEYLQARFDAAVEAIPAKGSAGREVVQPRADADDPTRNDADSARKRMIERQTAAWKAKEGK